MLTCIALALVLCGNAPAHHEIGYGACAAGCHRSGYDPVRLADDNQAQPEHAPRQSKSKSLQPPKKQEPRFGCLDYVIDEEMFAAMCDQLGLDDTQRKAAEELHRAYLDWGTEFGRNLHARVLDSGGREYGDMFLKAEKDFFESEDFKSNPRTIPRDIYPWDDLYLLFTQYHHVFINGLKESDARMELFYADMAALLTEPQLAQMSDVKGRLLTLNAEREYQESIRSPAFRRIQDFVPLHADPHRLLESAAESMPEIRLLLSDAASETVNDEQTDVISNARAKLQEALRNYELTMQAVHRMALADRRKMPDYRDARDFADSRGLKRDLRDAWVAVYRPVHDCNMQIVALLGEAFGEAPAEAWRVRYEEAFCPSLTKPRAPDYCAEWFADRADLNEDQVEASRVVIDEYRSRKVELLRATISVGVEMHFCERGNDGRYESARMRFNKHAASLRQLIELTLNSLRGVLNADQVRELDKYVRACEKKHMHVMGPPNLAN